LDYPGIFLYRHVLQRLRSLMPRFTRMLKKGAEIYMAHRDLFSRRTGRDFT
jgi:hypothetical protein